MKEQIGLRQAFIDLVKASSTAGVPVVLIGGFARNVYVRPRTTDEIDFLIQSEEDAASLVRATEATFAVTREAGLVVGLRHHSTGVAVDLLVAEHAFEREVFRHATSLAVFGCPTLVIPPAELAAMKVEAASDPTRPEDFGQVVTLVLEGGADPEVVERFVLRDLPAPAQDTWRSIRKAVERARSSAPKTRRRRG